MIVPIVAYGNEILSKEAEKLSKDFPKDKLEEILQNMKDTMENSGGVGIAAPQINQSIFVFIMKHFDIKSGEQFIKAYINPEIIEKSNYCMSSQEGCLSIPGITVHLYRPSKITVKYLDENFDEHEKELNGNTACIFQHEHDHLKGILTIDNLKKSKRKEHKQKLEDIKNGEIEVGYEMIFSKFK